MSDRFLKVKLRNLPKLDKSFALGVLSNWTYLKTERLRIQVYFVRSLFLRCV